MCCFTLPLRLVCATNAREHFRVVAKRKKEQRDLAALWTRGNARMLVIKDVCADPFRFRVTITRCGPRKMDSDNVATSAKYVRDGIADGLGVDDGDENKIVFEYKQARTPLHACQVLIEKVPYGTR